MIHVLHVVVGYVHWTMDRDRDENRVIFKCF